MEESLISERDPKRLGTTALGKCVTDGTTDDPLHNPPPALARLFYENVVIIS